MTDVAPSPLDAQPKWTRMPVRTRPHRNPLSSNDDAHPHSPAAFRSELPAHYGDDRPVDFVDIGCAFGGMLFTLAPKFPESRMLGLEIRDKVVKFAQGKATELRRLSTLENAADARQRQEEILRVNCPTTSLDDGAHHFRNVWFIQANVMKFGACFFERGQLSKMFFCYPDPHWKRNNVRRRIISPGLVQMYAYWLRPGGKLYTVSDVPELEEWMVQCLDASPLFERVSDEENESEQWLLDIVTSTSEDAKRTERKCLKKNYAVHRRIAFDEKKIEALF
jgi:tRNA (guanine-N7-)-methyltransferase